MIKKIIIAFSLVFAYNSGFAQPSYTDDQLNNYKLDNNVFAFYGEVALSTQELITNHKALFTIGIDDELDYDGFDADSLHFVKIKFNQLHNGIPVEAAKINFLEKENIVYSTMGTLVDGINAPATAGLNESDALEQGLSGCGVSTFMWESEDEESLLQYLDNDPNATYYPKPGKLVYTYTGDDPYDGTAYVLAWKFVINALSPLETFELFVDANTGAIVRKNSLTYQCGQVSNANTLYNGNKTIMTNGGGSSYELKDCNEFRGEIETIWASMHGLTYLVKNNSVNWGYNNQNPTSCHYAVLKAKEYYWYAWGRKGIDGSGSAKVTVRVDGTPSYNARAQYQNRVITVGKRSGNNMTNGTLDIMGHEYTHGVISYTAGLSQTGEPRALNESFADIFGNLVQRYATGVTEWTFGEDIGGTYYMDNLPGYAALGLPVAYHDGNWMSNVNATDYPQHNSSVHTYWFYLLASNIGIDKAAQIAYRNLTTYQLPFSNYPLAAIGSILAAKDLFGPCSEEVTQTIQAWQNVNVNVMQTFPYCITMNGATAFCTTTVGTNGSWVYTANYSAGTPIAQGWNVNGANINYTTNGNTLTVTKFNNANTKTFTYTGIWGSISNPQVYSKTINVSFFDCRRPRIWGTEIQFNPDDIFKIKGFKSSVVGTVESTNDVQIYPNPASEKVYVIFNGEKQTTVTISDLQGRILQKESLKSGASLNVSNLATGVYFVNIQTGDKVVVKKLNVIN